MTKTIPTETLVSLSTVREQVGAFVNGLSEVADGRRLAIARTKFEEAFFFLDAAVVRKTAVQLLLDGRVAETQEIRDFAARVEALDHDRLTVEVDGSTITIYAIGNSGEYAYSGDIDGAKAWYANFGRNLDAGLLVATKDENGEPISVTVPYAGAAERKAEERELDGALRPVDVVDPELADAIDDDVVRDPNVG